MDSSSSGFSSSGEIEETSIWKKEYTSNYYVYNSYVTMEENQSCEFKGHMCLTMKEIAPRLIDSNGRKSRAPISRAICSFFNSERGGTIYLGVIDSGLVKGLELSMDQREHLLVNLRDTLQQFNPPIDCSRLKVRFVPIVYTKPETFPEILLSDIVNTVDGQPHVLRSSKPCWCELNARRQIQSGIIHPGFIVELQIFPWRPSASTPRPRTDAKLTYLQPMYENEEGNVYIRGQGSQRRTGLAEILAQTRAETKDVLTARLADRQKLLNTLIKSARELVLNPSNVDENLSPLQRFLRSRNSFDSGV